MTTPVTPLHETPLLTVRGLNRSFSGVKAVQDLSFEVLPGQVVSIIGPNGSGKSTTINLLSGLLKPDSGSIRLRDREIAGLPDHRIAQLGARRTFQNGRVFADLTVEENVFVGLYHELESVHPFPRLRGIPVLRGVSIIAELLKALVVGRPSAADRARIERAVDDEITRYGTRLDPRRDHLAYTLSYANRRRTEIARALVSKPDILFLDEPTAGMNQTETAEVQQQLLDLKAAGQTMVLVEHKIDLVVALSDWVIVMDGGQEIAAGLPSLIHTDERVIEAYLGRKHVDRMAERSADREKEAANG